MAVVDPMRVYPQELRALLSTGESLVAAAMCQEAFGADRLERSPEDLDRMFHRLPERLRTRLVAAAQAEPGSPKAWERIVDVLTGTESLVKFDEAALFGVTASGHVGSCAGRLARALDTDAFAYLVVSDQRLIVAHCDDIAATDVTFAAAASLPLSTVLNARRAGTMMQRGRVVLDFVDLSQLALMTGVVFTGAANRLVAAINDGALRDNRQ